MVSRVSRVFKKMRLRFFQFEEEMKLKTHYVFSTGLVSLVLTLLFKIPFFEEIPFFEGFAISFIASFLGNTIIDGLGHKEVRTRYGVLPVRSPLTHTFPRSAIWGIISALPLFGLLFPYHHSSHYSDQFSLHFIIIYTLALLIAGSLTGLSHMLLDVFTENGIYVKKDGKWVRFAIAHFKYNDPLVNGTAVFVGAGMLCLAFMIV